MKTEYKIGNAPNNDIVIVDRRIPHLQATITYNKGKWIIENINRSNPLYINNVQINGKHVLHKTDKIRITNRTIYWANYLIEGDDQDLHLKDLCSINGRISRANYRTLSLLAIGMMSIIYFLPGLVIAIRYGRKGSRATSDQIIGFIQDIAPIFHFSGYTLLGIVFIIISLKRIRDTGYSLWSILIPFYNLKLLFFGSSNPRK